MSSAITTKNPFRIEGNVIWLDLGHTLETSVDIQDFPMVAHIRWKPVRHRNTWYAIGKVGAIHRLLLGLKKGDKMQADHRDGNGLNNCRSNLRFANHRQQQQNQRKRALVNGFPLTSKYKGVSWEKFCKRWRAQIRINGKVTHLGNFASQEEAAAAYKTAALKFHGEFAYTNH